MIQEAGELKIKGCAERVSKLLKRYQEGANGGNKGVNRAAMKEDARKGRRERPAALH